MTSTAPLALGPSCPHRPPCPGCPRFGEPGIAAAARAALESLARRHGSAWSGRDIRRDERVSSARAARDPGPARRTQARDVPARHASAGPHPELHRPASAGQSRSGRRAAGSRRCRRAALFGSGAPRSRPLPAGGGRARIATRAGRAGGQQRNGRAAGRLPRSDSRPARRRVAQPLVQRSLRAVEHHPGTGVSQLVRARQRGRAFRRCRRALSARRIRPEQSRHRRAHRRAPACPDSRRRASGRVLCRRGRHRAVAAVPRQCHADE